MIKTQRLKSSAALDASEGCKRGASVCAKSPMRVANCARNRATLPEFLSLRRIDNTRKRGSHVCACHPTCLTSTQKSHLHFSHPHTHTHTLAPPARTHGRQNSLASDSHQCRPFPGALRGISRFVICCSLERGPKALANRDSYLNCRVVANDCEGLDDRISGALVLCMQTLKSSSFLFFAWHRAHLCLCQTSAHSIDGRTRDRSAGARRTLGPG